MRFRIFCIFSAVLTFALLYSCKKEEDTLAYMSGDIKLEHSIPRYVSPGESYTLTASGVTAPDGSPVVYSLYSSVNSNVKDTVKTAPFVFTYNVPDTLGSFTLTVTAIPLKSSGKYYNTISSIYFTVVSDHPSKGSLTNIQPREDEINEDIYGHSYPLVPAGGMEWMRGNLGRIDRDASGNDVFGRPYARCKAMQYIFGAYYTWEEAQTACPPGWHLPSDAEWVALLKQCGAPASLQPLESSPSGAGNLMAKAYFNGEEMWYYYRGVKINDTTISAVPVGYATEAGGVWDFVGYQNYAVFWTSDEYEGQGVYRYIYKEYDNVFVGAASKTNFAASVRCVR